MNYIDLINNFWATTSVIPCATNEAAVYFYLLHRCNMLRWENPFELRTKELERVFNVSRATLAAIRIRLRARGVINFSEGKGKTPSLYFIEGKPVTDEAKFSGLVVHSQNNSTKRVVKLVVHSQNNKLNNSEPDSLYLEKDKSFSYEDDVRCKDGFVDDVGGEKQQKIFEGLGDVYEEVKTLARDDRWLDAIAKHNGSTKEQILELLPKFADFCVTGGKEGHESGADLKSHFRDWMMFKIDRKDNGINKSRNRKSGMRAKLPPQPGYGLVEA